MKVDMDDRASLERAISGAYGVFSNTMYWGLFGENQETAHDREIWQGKTIGDVCKEKGVKHLVYSGTEYAKDVLGKSCLHFDSKGTVEKYLDEIQMPNTSTRLAFYYENYTLTPVQKGEDGTYSMTWPMNGPMYAVSVDDLGVAVVTILDNPGKYIGKKLGLSGDRMSMHEYAAIISKVTGKTLKYNQVSGDAFSQFPIPGAGEMAAMFEFYDVGKPVRDIALTRTLNPNAATFEQWAEKNKDKFQWA